MLNVCMPDNLDNVIDVISVKVQIATKGDSFTP